MTQWLKQSTAVTVVMGPFVDATDGYSPEIAFDITEQEVLLSKNGGAFTLKHETTHGVHDASHNGWYTILLDTTDTNTLGLLDIGINMAGALPVWKSFMVVTADAWDSFLGAVVIGQAGAQAALVANNLDHLALTATAAEDMTTEVADNTILSRILGNGDTSTFVPSTDGLHAAGVDLDAILADTTTIDTAGEIAAAVWSADATTYQTQGTFGQAIGDPAADTNTIYKAVVTDATGATVGVDVVAMKVDTAAILADTGTDGVIVASIANDAITAAAIANGAIDAATFAAGAITAAAIATDAIDADALATDAILEIHNRGTLAYGTAQASTADTLVLAAATAEANDYFNGCLAVIVSGTGAGQARLVIDYIGASDTCVVDRSWVDIPDGTSVYRIMPFSGILLADTGVVAGAAASTVTLASSAVAVADTYVGHTIYISGGTGVGQARIITAYTAGRVATVSPAWITQPVTNASAYKILPVGQVRVNSMLDDSLTAAALATDAANEVADALLDRANGIETGLTLRAALRLTAAALAGKVSGAGTVTVVFRNAVVDGTDRIVATVDADGNRTAIAYDLA